MCSYIKTLSEIINEADSIDNILLNYNEYYAHIPFDKTSSKKPETLSEHVCTVNNYFLKLSKVHNLDIVVDRLINSLFEENKLLINNEVINFIKKLWVNIIIFHDYGKVNVNFQANYKKMNNPYFAEKETETSIGTKHSALGAYLYIVKHFQEISCFDRQYAGLLSLICITFSYSIFQHHSKYLNDNLIEKVTFSKDEVGYMKDYIKNYQWEIDKHCSEIIPHNTNKLIENLKGLFNSFALYNLIKLNFSLLTSADFLATGEYMNDITIEEKDFGVLTKERIDEIYKYTTQSEWLNKEESKVNFNKNTFEKANINYDFKTPKVRSNENLNLLRQEMGIEVIKKIRTNKGSNLFYIEAPTGGGKTNLSFLATIELLKNTEGLNKVFYVFPFTTLVTQTQKALIETLGLTEDEVIMLSSKSGFKESDIEDDNYGNQKQYYLDNLFSFYPFCLLTHIKFFNILKTNLKNENYLLHRLANSIVVIDELQAYSPTEWDKVIYFIKNYANFYNIKFLVMSATLPKLGKLNILKKYEDDFIYLIENAKERYFTNPNFAQRVSFNLDWFDKTDLTLDEIATKLLEESIAYSKKNFGNTKPINSVYAVIEFIFKKTASEFYEIINNSNHFFDEIFVLSGTILEHRRKYIISFLKNPENRKKKILLITTQVVEAGVDIDMDLGFKDISLIDSDEQLAGRINRNVNKQDCVLYLFNYNNEKIIYGKDKRYENTKKISKEQYIEILKTKAFDIVYNKILEDIDNWNSKEGAVGFSEYEQNIKNLRFHSVNDKFKLINDEHNNITVFIPLNVPIEVKGVSNNMYEDIFSKTELEYLKKSNIAPNLDNEIEGVLVFDLYLSQIKSKKEFIKKKVEDKILQGIMSKFIISMIGTNKIKSQLVYFQDIEKSDQGYVYLSRWEEIYSEQFGINVNNLYSNETQFL